MVVRSLHFRTFGRDCAVDMAKSTQNGPYGSIRVWSVVMHSSADVVAGRPRRPG
jgi:hypothetical protein